VVNVLGWLRTHRRAVDEEIYAIVQHRRQRIGSLLNVFDLLNVQLDDVEPRGLTVLILLLG